MLWDIHINRRVNGEIKTDSHTLEVPDTRGIGDVRTVYIAAHKKWGVREDDMLAVPHRDTQRSKQAHNHAHTLKRCIYEKE